MDTSKRTFTQALAGTALLAAAPRAALAQAAPTPQPAWPVRPVRLVIPFGVGGGSDVAARLIAQELSTRWGQSVIVENKPGADTSIAASDVQRAAPDGYSLLMTINSTLTLTPHTMKVPYDPMSDFTYVGQLTDVPLVVMVPEAIPVKTFGEFLDYARARPGQINIGGAATLAQLLAEQLFREAGVKFTWVMYKSGAEVTRALLSNEVHLAADAPAQNIPHIQSGKVRALAATGSARMSTLPDVPTFRELGMRAPLVTLQHYLLAPRGLPPALLAKIQQDVQAVLASAAVREKMVGFGFQSRWLEGTEAFKNVQAQHATTADLVRQAGLKPQ